MQFDWETSQFSELHELPVGFPMSYPYCEQPTGACKYNTSRPPAWCDRVLMSKAAIGLVSVVSAVNLTSFLSDFFGAPCDSASNHVSMGYRTRLELQAQVGQPSYDVIGSNVCMGDHKPVCLTFRV